LFQDLLQRIPEGSSLHDIAQEIELVAAVRQGLDELDRGEQIPIEESSGSFPHGLSSSPFALCPR